MRLLIIANPVAVHTQRWATAMGKRRHDVHVVGVRAAQIAGVEVHSVLTPAARSSVSALTLGYARLPFLARRISDAVKPDVVWAHYSVTNGVVARVARLRPVALTLWGSDVLRGSRPVGGFGRLLNRLAARHTRVVTAASEAMAVVFRSMVGEEALVEIVPFGVETDRYGSDFAPGPFTICFLKRLERKYGPDVAVEAFGEVAASVPDARLIMCGSGSLQNELKDRVAEMGLAGQVEFLGGVPHDRIPDVLSRCHLLVSPSRSESFGVALLEAAAAGLPVVAARVGGVPETVVDGVTGVLVAPDDAGATAQAIIDLASNEPRRVAMGAAARQRVEQEFEWDDCVLRMETALLRAAGR